MKYWLPPNEEFLPSTGFHRTGRVVTRYQLPMTEWSGPQGMGALPTLTSASPTSTLSKTPVLSSVLRAPTTTTVTTAKVPTPMLAQPVATTKEQMVINQTVASVASLLKDPGESASSPIVQPSIPQVTPQVATPTITVASQPSLTQRIIQAQQQAAAVNIAQSILPSVQPVLAPKAPTQVSLAPSLPQAPAPLRTAVIPTMQVSPQPAVKAEMISPGVISVQEPVREPYNDDPVSPIHSVTMEVEQPALTSTIAATVGPALRRTTYAPTPAPVRAPYNDDPAYVPPSPCSPGYWYNEETGECQQYQLTHEDSGFVQTTEPIPPEIDALVEVATPKTNWLLWGAVGLGVGGLIWYLTR